ncbi:MAG TPA: RNA-binding domain-containing protein [Methanomassiliicoccaceae archaeon]|jgi:predicted RNA binding protein with dsRBD fold (UPF0201 family)|nr:hypothetical protein [Euryarchaeota archaeon]HOB38469.1 RNA-binding domain-containing protein [Methanomassiliicoccaceae archaeon]HOK28675.1 RNA-binding domain-containing protein [Methanomassiliicoccaceae archaeon]HOL07387.1 RNA-binding domain-containing protein [Methanomassiliicoccaceae archaeon]HOQ25608.1 RNA-binding domain-containing protein [Methanomassiliicoccaceae archaeon]
MHIVARAACFPTEDREKVRRALLNLFPEGEVEEHEDVIIVRTESGERLRQLIIDHHIRDTARSMMLCGRSGRVSSFKLNKQVAYVNKISFVEGSPALGAIDIEVEDEDIDAAIDYLAESTVEVRQ